jgi:hypothetical protein
VNSVEILSYLTVARHVTRDEKYEREIKTLLNEHNYAENILAPMLPNPDYFTYIGYNLLAMSYPALFAYEHDPERRALYEQSLESWFHPVRRDGSPFFGYVYAAFSDGEYRPQACLEVLRDAPLDQIQWTVNNSQREDIRIVGRPVEGRAQTDRLLPPSERSIYRWDRNVYEADRGDGGNVEGSGVFWLTPYWMGRYYKLIAAPE